MSERSLWKRRVAQWLAEREAARVQAWERMDPTARHAALHGTAYIAVEIPADAWPARLPSPGGTE